MENVTYFEGNVPYGPSTEPSVPLGTVMLHNQALLVLQGKG